MTFLQQHTALFIPSFYIILSKNNISGNIQILIIF
jgi:hypothetical protein